MPTQSRDFVGLLQKDNRCSDLGNSNYTIVKLKGLSRPGGSRCKVCKFLDQKETLVLDQRVSNLKCEIWKKEGVNPHLNSISVLIFSFVCLFYCVWTLQRNVTADEHSYT